MPQKNTVRCYAITKLQRQKKKREIKQNEKIGGEITQHTIHKKKNKKTKAKPQI